MSSTCYFTVAYVKFSENESFINGDLTFEQTGETGYIKVYGQIFGLFSGYHGFRVNDFTYYTYVVT